MFGNFGINWGKFAPFTLFTPPSKHGPYCFTTILTLPCCSALAFLRMFTDNDDVRQASKISRGRCVDNHLALSRSKMLSWTEICANIFFLFCNCRVFYCSENHDGELGQQIEYSMLCLNFNRVLGGLRSQCYHFLYSWSGVSVEGG